VPIQSGRAKGFTVVVVAGAAVVVAAVVVVVGVEDVVGATDVVEVAAPSPIREQADSKTAAASKPHRTT
jgi:hypothetical protein